MPKKEKANASMTGALKRVGDAIEDASYHGSTTVSDQLDAMIESNLAHLKAQKEKKL
jgi:hypothetical protein